MKKITFIAGIPVSCGSQTMHRTRLDNKMYDANKEKEEKSTENCVKDAQASFSKIVTVNI